MCRPQVDVARIAIQPDDARVYFSSNAMPVVKCVFQAENYTVMKSGVVYRSVEQGITESTPWLQPYAHPIVHSRIPYLARIHYLGYSYEISSSISIIPYFTPLTSPPAVSLTMNSCISFSCISHRIPPLRPLTFPDLPPPLPPPHPHTGSVPFSGHQLQQRVAAAHAEGGVDLEVGAGGGQPAHQRVHLQLDQQLGARPAHAQIVQLLQREAPVQGPPYALAEYDACRGNGQT